MVFSKVLYSEFLDRDKLHFHMECILYVARMYIEFVREEKYWLNLPCGVTIKWGKKVNVSESCVIRGIWRF